MKNLYIYILLSFIISCQKKIELRDVITDDSLFKTIVIDTEEFNYNNARKPSLISVMSDSVSYIPLETKDNCLISKIEKMIVWNNRYYIWDKMLETIYCYGSDGKYIFKIAKKGAGPEEYQNISDFTVNQKNGDVYIRSDLGFAFFHYSCNGIFIKRTFTELIMSTFAINSKDTFLCYSGNLPNEFVYKRSFPEQFRYNVMLNNKVIYHQLKSTYYERNLLVPLSQKNFSNYKDTILLTEFMQPLVYWIADSNQLIPRYRIQFLNNRMELSFDETTDIEKMNMMQQSGGLTVLSKFCETDSYLLLSYANVAYGFAFVNKKTNKIHNLGYCKKRTKLGQ
jgi:hypothetical protein